MLLAYYSVYDAATNEFRPPFTARTEQEAIRGVRDSMKAHPDSRTRLHAPDLTLYRVGSFDIKHGWFDFARDAENLNPEKIIEFSQVLATIPPEELPQRKEDQ